MGIVQDQEVDGIRPELSGHLFDIDCEVMLRAQRKRQHLTPESGTGPAIFTECRHYR
jgi:hypothetical protein